MCLIALDLKAWTLILKLPLHSVAVNDLFPCDGELAI